jgi:hypothetical protein
MAERARAGETFAAIAKDYGISAERVRQIVKRLGVSGKDGQAVRKQRAVRDRTKACAECGTPFSSRAKGARYCSRVCQFLGLRGPRTETSRVGPDGYAMSRAPDGHWMMRNRERARAVRVERYMFERGLGRPLKHTEWVRLLDRDPDNLSPENIALMSPTEVFKMRGGMFAKANRNRTPSYTTLAAILRNGGHDE